jgi:O-antigen ligase
MNNFHIVSIHELVSHNAYTQVAAEMGLLALAAYIMFMLSPFKKLRQIERETFPARHNSRFYYLAIGFQASLVGYMVSSFFASVAYQWWVYYLVGYSLSLHRLYAAGTPGKISVSEKVSPPVALDLRGAALSQAPPELGSRIVRQV